jgi:hypothetical protein
MNVIRALASHLDSYLDSYKRCLETGNKVWGDKHEDSIEEIMKGAPSGSGFDSGTRLDWDESGAGKIVFTTSYHHMNDGGYYDGWTDHKVIVRPTFGGVDIRVTGRDRNDIKAYIGEVFDMWLVQEPVRREVRLYGVIINKLEVLPVLVGLDPELDKEIAERLSKGGS